LLAKAEFQSTLVLIDPALSRASPLPQGFVPCQLRSVGAFVIARLAADVDAAIIARFAGSMHAAIVTDFAGTMYAVVIANFACTMHAMIVPGFGVGAVSSGGGVAA
jgi:hypothetical protein